MCTGIYKYLLHGYVFICVRLCMYKKHFVKALTQAIFMIKSLRNIVLLV